MTRERPILFSTPMVRALLAGTKTQTRRALRPMEIPCLGKPDGPCPYGAPEDRLWVRETWRTEERASDFVDGIRFRADDAFIPIASTREAADAWVVAHDNGAHGEQWRPSIFMPRWASRITLEVTAVRVERLQDISEADARAEGVDGSGPTGNYRAKDAMGACRYDYATLWDSINGERAPWSSNPWVWVVSFRRVT